MNAPASQIKIFLHNQAQAWHHIRQRCVHGETPNGPGSTEAFTRPLRKWLPKLCRDHQIRSILDAPCGDWNWMQYVDLMGITYHGWDVDELTITNNYHRWPQYNWAIQNLLTVRAFPKVDLIICRDFMIHLPNSFTLDLLDRFRRSHSRFLLATNFPTATNAHACPLDGSHNNEPGFFSRPVNLEEIPFNLAGRQSRIWEAPGREAVLFDLQAES